MKKIEDPLFPGYVFSRFEPDARLPILTTPGVMGIVSFGQQLARIDEEEIAAIRTAVHNGDCQPWPYLAAGQMVRVTSGPLEGIEGVLAADKNSSQVVLSVSTLRRSIAVTVPKDMIEPVTSRQRGTASVHVR
jgi:transcription antitermination factor NusG